VAPRGRAALALCARVRRCYTGHIVHTT